MKAMYLLDLTFFCFTTLFILTCPIHLPSSDDTSANCALNLSSYSSPPPGECVGVQEKVYDWDGFPSSLCCRNALAVLSKALALYVSSPQDTIFPKDMWRNCNGSLSQQTYSVFVDSCGFDLLSEGSSRCSNLTLATVKNQKPYKIALEKCSHFENAFDEACANCTPVIFDVRNSLLEQSKADDDNNTERATCGVAAVISVAAGKLDESSFADDFYRCLPGLHDSESDYIKIRYTVAREVFATLIAIIILTLIILLIKYVTKKKPHEVAQPKEITANSGLYTFSTAEIEKAINFGNEKICLGRGSAGRVYKGVVPSGQVVAIKHIDKSKNSDSFTREVKVLSTIRHPNLVCLFGCCFEDGEQYLVYEYCPEGNLAEHLLRKDTVLTWDRRVRILRDCALALRYLHRYVDVCFVHRDIKLTNILLTEKLEAKLSDFGLAKMLGIEESKVFTEVKGTMGYMDPEYMSNAKLTCASDIYSFGIVILQLLSGRKVIQLDLDARDQLTRMAKDVAMGFRPVSDFEDPRLNGNFDERDFRSILQIAVLCVASTSQGRPNIDVVFVEIERAWKNTAAYKKEKHGMSCSATSLSTSLEAIPV